MKLPLSLLAIALVCAVLSIINLTSCQKDTIIQTGYSYHIKGDIFNKGVYQPSQPVTVNSLYTDPVSGLPYANVTDQNGTVWYIPQKDLK